MTHTYQQEGRWTGTLLIVSHPLAVDFPGDTTVCTPGIEKLVSAKRDDSSYYIDQVIEIGNEPRFTSRGIYLDGDNESLERIITPPTYDKVVISGGAIETRLSDVFDAFLRVYRKTGRRMSFDVVAGCCYFARQVKCDDEEWKEQAPAGLNNPLWSPYNKRVQSLGPGYKVGHYSGNIRTDAHSPFLMYFKGADDWINAHHRLQSNKQEA